MDITVQQSHSIISYFGNNTDWSYLQDNFDLEKIASKIEKNKNFIGELFVKFILDYDFENPAKLKNKNGFLNEKNIRLTHKILRLISENMEWSKINFKKNRIQERIIRNPFGAGRGFTDFLFLIMTDNEVGLVD